MLSKLKRHFKISFLAKPKIPTEKKKELAARGMQQRAGAGNLKQALTQAIKQAPYILFLQKTFPLKILIKGRDAKNAPVPSEFVISIQAQGVGCAEDIYNINTVGEEEERKH